METTVVTPTLNEILDLPTVTLRPSEQNREEIEKQCLLGLRMLKALSNYEGWGLDARDRKSSFITSLCSQPRAWSLSQLRSAHTILTKYEDQFKTIGASIPEKEAVDALISNIEERRSAVSTARPQIDVSEDKRWMSWRMQHYNEDHKRKFDAFKTLFANKQAENPAAWFCDAVNRRPEYDKRECVWTMPCSLPIYKTLTSKDFFPLTSLELLPGAQKYQAGIEEEETRVRIRVEQMTAKQQHRKQELLNAIGGLDNTFGGKKLYLHQREAIELLAEKDKLIIADETGLGKTLEGALGALMRQRADGVAIYVLTTVSSMDMWEETFKELGGSCKVFSWGSVPVSDAETPAERFVLIADEAQRACYESARCTQRFLDLAHHSNCDACYLLTGTPVPNGRPLNLYTLLLAMKHSLVYDANSKRRDEKKFKYLHRYCGAEHKHVGSGTWVWTFNGATFLWELNRLTSHAIGAQDNHRDACIIARLKDDCVDLPEKQRVLQPVEITAAAKRTFQDAVINLCDRFEESVKEKIWQFKWDYVQQNGGRMPDSGEVANRERSIRRAEAVVSYGIFRQAAAFAKVEHTVEQSQVIVDNGKHKLVIFTSFKEVARTIGAKLAKIYGEEHIGYIMDDVSREQRTAQMKDFQSKEGKLWIMISTAAGGEAITLTAAQSMIIVDRPWTPGKVKQWEDRIHRLTTTGTVTIYWLQLPKSLSDADLRVDAVIQKKQKDIDALQYGKVTAGMMFTSYKELEEIAESVIKTTRKRIRRKSAAQAAA